jgi:hypothetical protein
MFLASCWLPKRDMTLKVAVILRQRYAECKAASKVFRRPLPKWRCMGMVWHANHIKCDVFGARVFGSAKGHREFDSSNWFNSFSAEAITGLRWFSELLSVKTYFVEGC